MEYDYRGARDWIFGIQREGGRVTAYLPTGANIRERALLLALVEFAPNIEPSLAALAQMLGLGTPEVPDEKAVRRLLQSCEAKGFVRVEHRRGQRSRYTLAFDPGQGAPPGQPAREGTTPPHPGHHALPTQGTVPPKADNKADNKAEKNLEPLRLEVLEAKKDDHANAHKRVIDHYFAIFKTTRGRDPIFGGREANDVKRLLAKLKGDADEACRRISIAFNGWRAKTVTISDIANKPDAFDTEEQRGGVRKLEVQRGTAGNVQPEQYGQDGARAYGIGGGE